MSDDKVPAPSSHISELKVSGHLMTLEPGVYCVFSTPGSPAPSRETGLPVVRISAAPGQPESQVKAVGIEGDGWIGPNSATLVRISDVRAPIIVTVYQAADTTAEAPSLQVVRLSAAGVVPDGNVVREALGAQPPRLPPAAPQTPELFAHIYSLGDVPGRLGAWMGEPGSRRWIEGFGIMPVGEVPASDVEYQAVLGRGWMSPWTEGGQFCGSRAMSLPILGLRVRLRGESAKTHKVVLSATFVDGSQVGPVSDGEPCEAESMAALEAFHLAFVANDAATEAAEKPRRAAGRKPAASAPAAAAPVKAKRAPGRKPAAPVAAAPVEAPAASPRKPAACRTPAPVTPTKPTTRRR